VRPVSVILIVNPMQFIALPSPTALTIFVKLELLTIASVFVNGNTSIPSSCNNSNEATS
jgi:hypothetical protein